ncbi:MAG TPA: matrixin family metalloprotease [Myxococcota bacterium]|nr:matrixin family metalloprotease [Myxococcota bacterium]
MRGAGPRARPLGAALALGAALGALATPASAAAAVPDRRATIAWGDYQPDRRDYAAFRAAYPRTLEPNYLPFMVHRVPLGGPERDVMVFCHWAPDRFPLAVHIEPPVIPESLRNEFHPKPPEHYVTAVRAALETWERNLEGLVRFRYVATREEADVHVELRGEVGPEPESDVRVLGATPLGGACRVSRGDGSALAEWDPDAERLVAEFEVPRFRVFVADETGLLEPDQVERLALHEIGHLLGMSHHSPIPGDLMYEVARDRPLGDVLSIEDVNSFVSLYRMPSGTVFVTAAQAGSAERTPAPTGPAGDAPVLSVAPHVDARLGYQVRLPVSWTRIETAHGVIAVNGVTWDYDASFQVIVRRYPTIESYLERWAGAHLAGGRLVEEEAWVDGGRRRLRWVVRDRLPGVTEHLTFLETGDGRLAVVIADCASESYAAYRPWFEATVGTLEFWGEGAAPEDEE